MTLRKSFEPLGGWRHHTLFASTLILTAFSLTAVSPGVHADGINRGGTLIMARPDEPLTFDPFIPGDNGSIYAIEQVCDALIEADDSEVQQRRAHHRRRRGLHAQDPERSGEVPRLRAEAREEYLGRRRQAREGGTERALCPAALRIVRLCRKHREQEGL